MWTDGVSTGCAAMVACAAGNGTSRARVVHRAGRGRRAARRHAVPGADETCRRRAARPHHVSMAWVRSGERTQGDGGLRSNCRA
jgi:hypothetical protein